MLQEEKPTHRPDFELMNEQEPTCPGGPQFVEFSLFFAVLRKNQPESIVENLTGVLRNFCSAVRARDHGR